MLLLGPVEVVRADDAAIPGRVRRATELAAYLVLHPGASRHELDEVLWPGRRVGRSTRNPFISRTRQWLGRTPDGHAHLPLVGDEAAYRLLPVVGCDWHDFVRHALAGLATEPVDSAELTAALQLVRGRPFQGIDPSSYAWAEPDVQDIVSTVVDVAHVLAGRALEDGDAPAAARAAARGLLAEPGSETLHRDAIRAALLRGDRTDVERAVERMHAAFEALDLDDDDLMPETRSLINELVPSRTAGQGRGRHLLLDQRNRADGPGVLVGLRCTQPPDGSGPGAARRPIGSRHVRRVRRPRAADPGEVRPPGRRSSSSAAAPPLRRTRARPGAGCWPPPSATPAWRRSCWVRAGCPRARRRARRWPRTPSSSPPRAASGARCGRARSRRRRRRPGSVGA